MADSVNISSARTINTGSVFNSTLNASTRTDEGEKIISAVLLSILALIVVIGNGMVMLAFKVNKKLRTVTNMFLVNLALSDFLVGVFSIPLWVYFIFYTSANNMYLHMFYLAFDMIYGTASIFQLTAISLERCFSTVAPFRHRSMPRSFFYAMIFAVWFLAVVISLLILLPIYQITDMKWYRINMLVCHFALPVVIIISSYSIVLFKMRQTALKVRSSKSPQASWPSQRKTIITLLIITGLFMIAWSPFFIATALFFYFPQALPSTPQGVRRLTRFVKWMQYSNSCFNPFVYSYRNTQFKNTFRALLHACIKRKSFEEVNREFIRRTRVQ